MSNQTIKKLGIIAGEGVLPKDLSINAQNQNYETYIIAVNWKSFFDLKGKYTEAKMISPTQAQKCLDYFKAKNINEIVFIGKIHKLWAIAQIPFLDSLAQSYFKRMLNLEDNTFHQLLAQICDEQGLIIIPQSKFLSHLLSPKEVFTKRNLTDLEKKDIEYGFQIAKKASELEVSQTVVVKNSSVMAFEAAEGTDQTIKRGCQLAHSGAVIIKVAWKKQSDKFDLPTVGCKTIKNIAKHKGSVLAIEANSTFIAEKEKTIALADKLGIAFLAI
jgi:UDP-2,3-diacylglucosamine hydrolase